MYILWDPLLTSRVRRSESCVIDPDFKSDGSDVLVHVWNFLCDNFLQWDVEWKNCYDMIYDPRCKIQDLYPYMVCENFVSPLRYWCWLGQSAAKIQDLYMVFVSPLRYWGSTWCDPRGSRGVGFMCETFCVTTFVKETSSEKIVTTWSKIQDPRSKIQDPGSIHGFCVTS